MPLRIDPDNSKNIEFLEFVIGKIKAKQDQEMPNFIEILIQKGITIFPVFEKIEPSGDTANAAYERMRDENKKDDQEAEQICKYLLDAFKENIEMRVPLPPVDNPLALVLIIVIKNLHGVYMVAEELRKKEPNKPALKVKGVEAQEISLPIVEYDSESGLGHTNGEKFKLKNNQPDYAVFAELYENIGMTVPYGRVLELSGFARIKDNQWEMLDREKAKKALFSHGAKYFVNKLAVKMRKAINLSDTHLIINNGDMILRVKGAEKETK